MYWADWAGVQRVELQGSVSYVYNIWLKSNGTESVFYHIRLLLPQTCIDEDCATYSTCINCALKIVDNTLQQRESAACESECGTISIVQISSASEIPNRNSLKCSEPLVGDTCVVEYYFTFIQGMETQPIIYVINTPTRM